MSSVVVSPVMEDHCFVCYDEEFEDTDDVDENAPVWYKEEPGWSPVFDAMLIVMPFLSPVLAFFAFDSTIVFFHASLDWIANLKWVPVDGGASRAASLLPVMNGNVLPSVSFALGTLTATTISGLRSRQISLRTSLNTEACIIRSLHSNFESLFPKQGALADRKKSALLLRQYCSRVLKESQAGVDLEKLGRLGAANCELQALARVLHHASVLPRDGVQAPRFAPRFEATTEFLAQMQLEKLQVLRSSRLATLETTFPAVHWSVLSLLALSVIFGFLVAADQDVLRFLASLQLRLLYSILVGALGATAVVCIDLNDPFRGSFQITPSSEQLVGIRAEIDYSINLLSAEKKSEAKALV